MGLKVGILIIIIGVQCCGYTAAGGEPRDTIKNTTPKEEQRAPLKDVRDVFAQALRLSVKPDSLKMKGNGPFVSVIPIVGYAMQSGYTGAFTTSTSFYASDSRDRFSSLNANFYYSQYHQYWTIVNSNIFIDKLKLHLFGDWRYYNFPTNTYGIGSHTLLSNVLPIDYSYVRFYQTGFREIRKNVFVGMGYNLDLHWNIATRVDTGKVYNEIQRNLHVTRSVSSGLSVNCLYDNRKNSVNSEGGTFASFQIRPNFTFLGSDANWQSLLIDVRHYIRFPASSRNVLGFWSYNNITIAGKPPYLDMPSIGWDSYSNTGRGYVPGRYTGRNLLYAESEYRFALTRNGLLGGVVFGNAETILRRLSTELHTVIPGYGLGLRIKLNKYSSTNLAIDYGFGIGGSRGFFFNLGEVF
jgi:hypothetical protein